MSYTLKKGNHKVIAKHTDLFNARLHMQHHARSYIHYSKAAIKSFSKTHVKGKHMTRAECIAVRRVPQLYDDLNKPYYDTGESNDS